MKEWVPISAIGTFHFSFSSSSSSVYHTICSVVDCEKKVWLMVSCATEELSVSVSVPYLSSSLSSSSSSSPPFPPPTITWGKIHCRFELMVYGSPVALTSAIQRPDRYSTLLPPLLFLPLFPLLPPSLHFFHFFLYLISLLMLDYRPNFPQVPSSMLPPSSSPPPTLFS